MTIQIKFQNHIYGHNLADDKIKTRKDEDSLKHVQFQAIHTYNIHMDILHISFRDHQNLRAKVNEIC